jgi:hypothetical protein
MFYGVMLNELNTGATFHFSHPYEAIFLACGNISNIIADEENVHDKT